MDNSFGSRNSHEFTDVADLVELEESRLTDRKDMWLESKVGVKSDPLILSGQRRGYSVVANSDIRQQGI